MERYVKYPRTFHVPWTESITKDDRVHEDLNFFQGKKVVVTEKRDGENSSIYSDGYFHARSVDGDSHPSQSWLKNFMRQWYFNIPEGWRVCGESLYAIHSIQYDDLISYFEVFSIWNDMNECLSWLDTKMYCELLELSTVPVLFEGIYDEDVIKGLDLDEQNQEGYVIRLANKFPLSAFKFSCAKYVRKNHVQDTVHNWRNSWDSNKINKLKG